MSAEEKTYWHPAFYAAIQIELEEYKDKLTFTDEFQLTQEPLKMDVLIVRKEPGLTIQKNIGKIFKGHNIIEFKSESDYISVSDFHKVQAYGMFYISLNNVHPCDLTLTFVTRTRPLKLFSFLKDDLGCEVQEALDGIYYLNGYGVGTIPIQIIVTERLPEDDNLWIKSLTRSIEDKAIVEKILTKYQEHTKEANYDTYLKILLEANPAIFMEVFRMIDNAMLLKQEMTKVFEEKGWIAEIEQKAEERAEERRNINLALEMLSDQESEEKIMRYSKLSMEKILELKTQL